MAHLKNLEISSPAVFRVSRHIGIPNKQKTMQKSFPYVVAGVKCPYPAKRKRTRFTVSGHNLFHGRLASSGTHTATTRDSLP